jgi:hypothetical protein
VAKRKGFFGSSWIFFYFKEQDPRQVKAKIAQRLQWMDIMDTRPLH